MAVDMIKLGRARIFVGLLFCECFLFVVFLGPFTLLPTQTEFEGDQPYFDGVGYQKYNSYYNEGIISSVMTLPFGWLYYVSAASGIQVADVCGGYICIGRYIPTWLGWCLLLVGTIITLVIQWRIAGRIAKRRKAIPRQIE